MTQKRFSRRPSARPSLAAACALLFVGLVQTPVSACIPVETGVSWVTVTLIEEPFGYDHYIEPYVNMPEDWDDLPDPPDHTDEDVRAEHAYVSVGLATALGLSTVEADWETPNPQIRLLVHKPSTIANFHQQNGAGFNLFRNRASGAVFTVVGVVAGEYPKIFVYGQVNDEDRHSGQYKLLAHDTALPNGDRVVEALVYQQNPGGELDTLKVRVWPMAPSRSTFTPDGAGPIVTQHFCEADPNGSLTESAVEGDDNLLLVMAPHGGNIEIGTSAQAAHVVDQFDGAASFWGTEGVWGDGQTSPRWHITSTSISEVGFPALADVMPDDYFVADEIPFRYAVSFHGFGADDTSACLPLGGGGQTNFYQVIVGGDADENDKCLVATRIREAIGNYSVMDTFGVDAVAVSIRLTEGGSLEGADSCGREVDEEDKSGTDPENVVNRLSADGGFQIEQSDVLRDNAVLRLALAGGVAQALEELLAGPAPGNACAAYD